MSRQTYIYFLATQDRSLVKIGCSYHSGDRLEAFARWSPVPLDLLGEVPGTLYDERALHTRYLHLHSHGEWFHASLGMLQEIEDFLDADELPEGVRADGHVKSPFPRKNDVRLQPGWREKNRAACIARWAQIKASRAAKKARAA